jgi:hypothetical protein
MTRFMLHPVAVIEFATILADCCKAASLFIGARWEENRCRSRPGRTSGCLSALTINRSDKEPAMSHASWKPQTEHGKLSDKERTALDPSVFAFPKQRKEPLTDAAHVRNALARFDQVEGVTDDERDLAFENIKLAAKHYGVDVAETNWRQLGKHPHTPNPAQD